MLAGKIACRGLAGLLVGLSCLGCHALAHRHAPPPPVEPPPPAASPPTAPPPRTAPPPPPPQVDTGAPPGSAGAAIVAGPLESPPVFSATSPLSPAVPLATAEVALASRARPVPSATDSPPADPLRRLAEQAAATYAAIPGYTARLRQREQVAGRDRPEEVMEVKFRPEPWSVYFRWVGPEARGREVVYVEGRYGGKIHTRLAAGDVPLMPAGARFSVAPDSVLARGRSRHPITEAGIGSLVQRFGQLAGASGQGGGRLTYLGPQSRPEFPAAVEAVEEVIPPGAEPALPGGGRRLWCFAPDSHLPVLISTRDSAGHEVEYYCYDQVRYPVQLTDEDFNPDHLWARR